MLAWAEFQALGPLILLPLCDAWAEFLCFRPKPSARTAPAAWAPQVRSAVFTVVEPSPSLSAVTEPAGSSPRGPRLPRMGCSPGSSEPRNRRTPAHLKNPVTIAGTLTASSFPGTQTRRRQVRAQIRRAPRLARRRLILDLVCGIHLRDPLKPVRSLPGLAFVPGASNCSSHFVIRRGSAFVVAGSSARRDCR